jgi:fructosamine-3-kinase
MGSAERGLPPALAAAIARELGGAIESCTPVAGGDSFASVRVQIRGRAAFVKLGDMGASHSFAAEADGLEWLREADAVRVPEVLAIGEPPTAFLALAWIDTGERGRDHDALLGRGLAALHRHGAPSFGHTRDNVCGRVPQDNGERPDWPSFYGEQRLRPLLERTRAQGVLDRSTAAALAGLIDRLPELCGPPEPPARLHGDLWAGNAICDRAGQPVLVDPAVYGGHREVDLAMMRLFGGFSPRSFDAYAEAFPLAPGAGERVALYQLYPLLVHVAMFGHGYVGQLRGALASATRMLGG